MLTSRRSLAADVCWRCQFQLSIRQNTQKAVSNSRNTRDATWRVQRRALHATTARTRPSLASNSAHTIDPSLLGTAAHGKVPIRQHLQRWHEDFGGPDEEALNAFGDHPAHGNIQNSMSKLTHGSKADDPDDEIDIAGREADREDEDDELITIGLFLKPGDVVELSQPGREPVLAVFVRQLDMTSQFFSVRGRWCHTRLATISFAVPGCINPVLLEPLISFMPTKPEDAVTKDPIQIPREIGAPVQAILDQLTVESERIYRTNASVLDTAYTVLGDANRTRMMTLAQIAKTLLGNKDPTWTPSPAALLAVRKALNHNAYRFRSDTRSQRLTNVFSIRPKTEVEVVETVQEWVREYREHEASLANKEFSLFRKRSKGTAYVSDFIEKARRLVAVSRKHRTPHPGFVGPSQAHASLTEQKSCLQIVWGENFTEADTQIVNFLQAWVLGDQFKHMPNLHAASTAILHATGCYGYDSIHNQQLEKTTIGRVMGHLFLQEIGVITPHENRTIYEEQLMLPTVRPSRNLELLNTKAELTRRNPDFRDQMAHLRRDWGSTTIFCIDDAGAKEIDDGVSVERVPGRESEFWVHVHVANPTAFFDKSHVLSGLAAHMTETIYTPERSFPMLPAWAARNYFSLDCNRPVITFSSRLDASGNIVETKIQHGIIRKVLSITYNELSACLGENNEGEIVRTVVGGEIPAMGPTRTPPQLSPEQLQNAQDLYAAAKVIWKGRKAAGGVRMGDAYTDVRVYENSRQPGLAWLPPSVDRSRRIQGDPVIEMITKKSTGNVQNNINSSNIVEEMMLLACRSAASWCAERNIPVMFRGTVQPPSQKLSLEQFKLQVLQPHIEKHGSISPGVGFRYIEALGRAIAHSAPLSHKIIGAEAYVKVTSPLRRFSDMIAHWQIEAAIRYEARTGHKLNSTVLTSASRPILPFSQQQMQESIITLSPREKIISQTKRSSVHQWIVQAFMRAFYYKEAPLPVPDNFKVWIRWHQVGRGEAIGYIDSLSIKVFVMSNPGTDFQMGDQWEVKMHHVDIFMRGIFVEPIRLLYRDEDVDLA